MKPRITLLFIALLIGSQAFAQNEARITTARLTRGSNEAQFTLSVRCNGEPFYNLSTSQLIITDNEKPVEEFEIIESSSAIARYPLSVALVLDASGSMMGAGNAGAKAAGHDFVDFLDGVVDEVSVLWFTSVVTVYQQMTTNKPMLHASVDALPASGATAVWDGILAGLNEVAANGQNAKRAVLVLTDGGDNSSSHSPAECIAFANRNGLRVFTVGLGTSINAVELQLISQLTGGLYFQTPNASQLQQIFTDIASFIGRGYDEHTISFRTPDPDALTHTLSISVRTCNEVLHATRIVNQASGLSVGDAAPALPFDLQLGQNAPNPFAASTTIPFSLQSTGVPQPVRLEVYDILGRSVATLFNATIPAGNYSVPFTPTQLAQGMYVIRLSSGAATQYRTMLLQR